MNIYSIHIKSNYLDMQRLTQVPYPKTSWHYMPKRQPKTPPNMRWWHLNKRLVSAKTPSKTSLMWASQRWVTSRKPPKRQPQKKVLWWRAVNKATLSTHRANRWWLAAVFPDNNSRCRSSNNRPISTDSPHSNSNTKNNSNIRINMEATIRWSAMAETTDWWLAQVGISFRRLAMK